MRVRIKLAGGYESVKIKAAYGEVIEVDDATGVKLISHELAEFVAPEPAIESVVAEAPSNTAPRTTKPKARRSSPPAKKEAD